MKIKQNMSEYLILEDEQLKEINFSQLQKGWTTFFNASENDKIAFAHQPNPLSGYFPYGLETAVSAPQPDPKDFFHIYSDTLCPDYLYDPTIHLFLLLKSLAINTLNTILEQRGIKPIPPDSVINSPNHVMRIAHYPFDSKPKILAWDHADINFITVIPQTVVPGLQVMRDGVGWIACDPQPGQAVVLFGDMMADWTNGIIPATRHRVVNALSERISFNFFTNPKSSLRLSPRWTAGEFLKHRMQEIGLNY